MNAHKREEKRTWSRKGYHNDGRLFLPGDTIKVYVEGYEDVSFWRNIFDEFETPKRRFVITAPQSATLTKGKQVLLKMAQKAGNDAVLCMDADFDYLFFDQTNQAKLVNSSSQIFHTYGYSIENYLCYAPSLHNLCVKATKNDMRIFDFERFMFDYSKIIYPLFLWYAYSAQISVQNIFTLSEFRNSIQLNFLEIHDNGRETLNWLYRQVNKKRLELESLYSHLEQEIAPFSKRLAERGVEQGNCYLFMQGHALLDKVVMVLLNDVCKELREISTRKIVLSSGSKEQKKNEMSNYNNAQRRVREIILDNEHYKDCFLFKMLKDQIAARFRF